MKAAERQLRIRQMFESRDFLDLETLCRELDASESSVRRDLGILEDEKALRRVYGGAVPLQSLGNRTIDFAEQSARQSDEKNRIARLTAGLIEEGQTVILDGGSTVAAVARELAGSIVTWTANMFAAWRTPPCALTLTTCCILSAGGRVFVTPATFGKATLPSPRSWIMCASSPANNRDLPLPSSMTASLLPIVPSAMSFPMLPARSPAAFITRSCSESPWALAGGT